MSEMSGAYLAEHFDGLLAGLNYPPPGKTDISKEKSQARVRKKKVKPGKSKISSGGGQQSPGLTGTMHSAF